MSKKVFNVFSILCFALVLCFIGCTELINPKTETDINLNIDLSKIIKSTRNTGETQSSASIGENPTIKVAIYDAKKYNATTNSTGNLDLITEAQAQIVDNEAKVKLNNIPVGIYAIVFAELSFSNGNSTEVMYAGNSKVFKVKASDNKVSLILKKVANSETSPDDTKPEETINAKEPEIIIQPISCVKTTTESTTGGTTKTTLTCTAKSTDGGNLSFMWYKSDDGIYFKEFNDIKEPSLNGDGYYTSSTSEIEAQEGKRLYFYCVVTNTNEKATEEKVASVQSDIVQVACIKGTLSNIKATYKLDSYELWGKDFTYSNVSVTETYTSSDDATEPTIITVFADESRYKISPNTDSENAIGYVPYTVTRNDSTLEAIITVPVKYELDANNLVLETCFNSISVSESDTDNAIKIPQYGTVKYVYRISDNDKISIIDENGTNTVIEDINNTDYYTATIVDDKNQDIGSIDSVGDYKYTVTLQSANKWFVCNSNKSKDFSIEVCPWEISLTLSESTSTVDPNNISLGTYHLSISNYAYTTSQNPPSATFSCFVNGENIITNKELTIDDNFIKGTITATVGNNEVASLEISRENTSVTYAEGLTCDYVQDDGTVTLYISNADGLATFRNIVNGTLPENTSVRYDSNENSDYTFEAKTSYPSVNGTLRYSITLSGDWTPIGVYSTTPTSAKPYSGTFDGNGKTITFDSITHESTEMYSSGLFQMLAGTVKNLIIAGSIFRTEVGYIGSITGYLDGGTIENCVNNAFITNSASIGTGGIVGYVGTAGGKITGCINLAKVLSSESSVGGIVGATGVMSETNVSISKCINMGEISGASNISGILGTAVASQISISDCMNLGVISTNNTSEPAYASGITTPSEDYTVSSCINVGQVTAAGTNSFQGGISSVTTKGKYTNNYYDSTVNPVVDDSSTSGITKKSTTDLIGSSSNLSLQGITTENWSFEEGRYPLPDIAGNIPGDENGEMWNAVIAAATPDPSSVSGGGIDGRYVNTADELNYALEDPSVNIILINANISIDSTINITRDVTIAANNDVTLTQNVTDYEMINVAADVNFVLGGGSGTLTIKGNSSLTQNIIYSKGNVTLKDKLVINNSYASNGVIFVYAGSLKMEGGEISDNQSNAITSNMKESDVTIDIYGGKIYNNTKNSSYYGSAIYIINSLEYDATVNIYGEAQIFNNNNSSGAAIRLNDDDSVLYINSSASENSAKIYDNITTNIQIDAGQLFINNTEIDLSNYTDSNIL